jgi:enoyl-CoA hydratase/carnithine racemase
MVYEGLERGIDEHMEVHTANLKACIQSKDHVEGVKAFLEKRQPVFTGE